MLIDNRLLTVMEVAEWVMEVGSKEMDIVGIAAGGDWLSGTHKKARKVSVTFRAFWTVVLTWTLLAHHKFAGINSYTISIKCVEIDPGVHACYINFFIS